MSDITCIAWVPSSGGNRPSGAVHAGVDRNDPLFVARGYHQGSLIPGKLHPANNTAYICHGGEEIPINDYEVLVAPPSCLSWVRASNGAVPPNAVVGGHEANGETYYIGRAITNGTLTAGKVHPSNGCCYLPYDRKEEKVFEYEVLVRNMYGMHLGV